MTDARVRRMRLRYDGVCACGARVAAGTHAGYISATKTVVCPFCLESDNVEPSADQQPAASAASPSPRAPTPATASSLQREYERRKQARADRVTTRFARAGKFLLAITPEPASTTAFKTGAEGERKAAERILGRAGDDALFLHNRRLGPGRRDGDLDLIAVTARGVLVIDVKHYKDAKVEVRSRGGLFSARTQQLYVGGRDKTAWVEGMGKQHDAVRAALDAHGHAAVSIFLTLCFVDADLPLLEKLSIGDIAIYGSRQLGKRIKSADGPYNDEQRMAVFAALDRALPPA